MDLLTDLLCILFFAITGCLCLYYVWDNWQATTYFLTGRKYVQHRALEIVAVIVGLWHLLYAVMQAANLVAWSVLSWMN